MSSIKARFHLDWFISLLWLKLNLLDWLIILRNLWDITLRSLALLISWLIIWNLLELRNLRLLIKYIILIIMADIKKLDFYSFKHFKELLITTLLNYFT